MDVKFYVYIYSWNGCTQRLIILLFRFQPLLVIKLISHDPTGLCAVSDGPYYNLKNTSTSTLKRACFSIWYSLLQLLDMFQYLIKHDGFINVALYITEY